MKRPAAFYVQMGPGRSWLAILLAIIFIAGIVLLVSLVALGLFVILAPVVLIAAIVFALFPKLRPRPAQWRQDTTIIEGDYRILDPGDSGDKPPAQDPPRLT